ncbi:MAG TPA: nickel ABC transporter permease [Chloroflexota bacterium]|jgi:peptide/nickel transport system permease protein
MQRYIIRRLLLAVPVLLGVSVAVFSMMHLIPGDPALAMLRGQPQVTEADVFRVREDLGLNDPVPVQYIKYLSRVVQGDFGRSVQTKRPVLMDIAAQAPSTLQLALTAVLLAVTLGVVLGVVSALRQNSWVDTLAMLTALFGVSMPSFWFGLILIFVFSLKLGWLPATGQGGLERLILPAVALGMDFSAVTARMVRANLLEVLVTDYVRTARAKGVAQRMVVIRHALRNAMIPAITIVGLQLGTLLGGAVVVETVFARQGIGRLLVTAIMAKDFPVVQGVVLLAAAVYLLLNLLIDLTYAFFDPRIRYS